MRRLGGLTVALVLLLGLTAEGQWAHVTSGTQRGAACGTLCDGLIHYWNLDEESGTRADAVGDADLSDVNTVGFAAGINGNAANFVAASNQALAYAGPVVDGSQDYTVLAWILPASAQINPGDYSGFGQGNNGLGSREWWLCFGHNSANYQHFIYNSDDTTTLTEARTMTQGAWHLVGMRLDMTARTIAVSQNGEPWATTALAPGKTPKGPSVGGGGSSFELGRYAAFQGARINGRMDAVAVYDRAISDAEVAEAWADGAGKFYDGSTFQ